MLLTVLIMTTPPMVAQFFNGTLGGFGGQSQIMGAAGGGQGWRGGRQRPDNGGGYMPPPRMPSNGMGSGGQMPRNFQETGSEFGSGGTSASNFNRATASRVSGTNSSIAPDTVKATPQRGASTPRDTPSSPAS
jgi:type IV secretion system protein VirB6